MYSYRDAKGNDFEEICLFPKNEEEAFYMFPRASYPLISNELEISASQRFQPTTFLEDENVVGYANIIKIESEKWGSLGNIIVAPKYRRQGVGHYILNIMSQKLEEIYFAKELRLACFSTNTSGLILYHKYGFVPYLTEIRKDYKDRDTVLIHLKKDI